MADAIEKASGSGRDVLNAANDETDDAVLHQKFDRQKQWDFGLDVIRSIALGAQAAFAGDEDDAFRFEVGNDLPRRRCGTAAAESQGRGRSVRLRQAAAIR